MKNEFTTITQRRKTLGKNHGKKLMLCIWWDQLGVVYYELLKLNETITRALYRTQLMRLSRVHKEKRAHYYSRHDKVFLLHDNARPTCCGACQNLFGNTQVGGFIPPAVFTRHCSFWLLLVLIDGTCLSEQPVTSYEDTKNWVDSWIVLKDEAFFRRGICILPERWEKVVASDGQYFE